MNEGMECSLTSCNTVCGTRQGVGRSLHGVLWYQTRGGTPCVSIYIALGACVMYTRSDSTEACEPHGM